MGATELLVTAKRSQRKLSSSSAIQAHNLRKPWQTSLPKAHSADGSCELPLHHVLTFCSVSPSPKSYNHYISPLGLTCGTQSGLPGDPGLVLLKVSAENFFCFFLFIPMRALNMQAEYRLDNSCLVLSRDNVPLHIVPMYNCFL